MLRQSPTDPKWFDDNVNDFSLSSFLGHLEAATSTTGATTQPNGSSSSSSVDTPIKSVSTSMHADVSSNTHKFSKNIKTYLVFSLIHRSMAAVYRRSPTASTTCPSSRKSLSRCYCANNPTIENCSIYNTRLCIFIFHQQKETILMLSSHI